jgi:hypothetical protein
MSDPIVTIKLTRGQTDELAPVIREHARQGRNALFITTISPGDDGYWKLQTVTVDRAFAQKVLKILADCKTKNAETEPK